jgi:hypothetical protein
LPHKNLIASGKKHPAYAISTHKLQYKVSREENPLAGRRENPDLRRAAVERPEMAGLAGYCWRRPEMADDMSVIA